MHTIIKGVLPMLFTLRVQDRRISSENGGWVDLSHTDLCFQCQMSISTSGIIQSASILIHVHKCSLITFERSVS